MDPIRDPREHRDVAVVPEPELDVGGDVRGVMDLDLLGADHRPAPLRLDPAHPSERGRVAVPHSVAVRHLVEAVLRGHRADRDRLEEHVVARIAPCISGHHRPPAIESISMIARRCRYFRVRHFEMEA